MWYLSVIHVPNRQFRVFQSCVESDFETTEAGLGVGRGHCRRRSRCMVHDLRGTLIMWAEMWELGDRQKSDPRRRDGTGTAQLRSDSRAEKSRGNQDKAETRQKDKTHNKRHSNSSSSETRTATSPVVTEIFHRTSSKNWQN